MNAWVINYSTGLIDDSWCFDTSTLTSATIDPPSIGMFSPPTPSIVVPWGCPEVILPFVRPRITSLTCDDACENVWVYQVYDNYVGSTGGISAEFRVAIDSKKDEIMIMTLASGSSNGD